MSVDYSLGYCKGWVFDESTFNKFQNILEKIDDYFYDEFIEEYVLPINSWVGYSKGIFIGVSKDLGNDNFCIDINQLETFDNCLQKDIKKFCTKISEHKEIINFLHSYPTNTFIINFCF